MFPSSNPSMFPPVNPCFRLGDSFRNTITINRNNNVTADVKSIHDVVILTQFYTRGIIRPIVWNTRLSCQNSIAFGSVFLVLKIPSCVH